MTALADVLAGVSLDDLAREATLARTCGHHLAGDVLDALVEMLAPETPDLDCARALRRACVTGSEYQRLAEQLDRFRESYRMACRMLRDAEAERRRARNLAARLEEDGARLRERVAEIATAAQDHADWSRCGESCGGCQSGRIAHKLRGALDAAGGAS